MSRRIDENKMNYFDQYEHLQSSSQKLSRCRVCLDERNDLQNLFSSTKMNYASIIEQCALVDVRENDGFPQNICIDCIQLLRSAHKFKTLCEQSNQTLRLEAINHVEIKIEKELIIENQTESSATLKTEAQSNDNDGDSHFGMFDDVNTDQFDHEMDSLDNGDRLDPKYAHEEVRVSTEPKKPKKSRKSGEVKIKVPRPSQKLQCDECEYETIVPTNLEDHKRSRHQGILDFYKCEHCPKGFPTQLKLQNHFAVVHDINPISCETCGKTFKNKRLLDQHNLRTHLGHRKIKPQQKLQCDECGYTTVGSLSLKDHKRSRHQGILDFYKCGHCPKGFTSQAILQKHCNLVHEINPMACETCGKTFKNKSLLYSHNFNVHLSVRKHRCDYCTFMARTKYDLKKHQKTMHTANSEEYPCKICNKVYKSQYTLSAHNDRVHKNIRSFQCDECDKSFFRSLTLKQHKLLHSGLKPYICHLCPGIAYSWYSALLGHNATAHPGNKLENESSMYKKCMANLMDNRTEENS